MPIQNITRTNTIDEWRIQTNQSANAINNIETGDFNKTNGTFFFSGNAALVITATGTPLAVSNAALFSTDVTIGKNLVLGARVSDTGNLTVGSNVSLMGKDNGLYVANNTVVNKNLQVTQNVTTNNILANVNVTVLRTTQSDNLIITGITDTTSNNSGAVYISGGVGISKSAFLSGNLTIQGDYRPDSTVKLEIGSLSSNSAGNVFIRAADTSVGGANGYLFLEGNALITGNTSIGSGLVSTSKTTGALKVSGGLGVSANIHTTDVIATNSLVADSARITANTTGSHFIASGSMVSDSSRVTANSTASHFIASGSLVADNARITANTTGSHFIASGSFVADSARITANTTGSHFIAANSFVSPSARFTSTTETTSNAVGAVIISGGLGVSKSAFISGNVTVKGDAQGSVNNQVSIVLGDISSNSAGNLVINSGQTSTGGSNGSLSLYGNGTITGNLTVGSGLESTSNNSSGALKVNGGFAASANIHGNALYDNGNRVARTVSSVFPISSELNAATGHLSLSHDNSGVTVASHGTNIQIPIFQVNEKGHITSVTNTTIRSTSTSQTGVVQLEDTLGGTSVLQAPTVNHVTVANTNMKNYVDVANTRMKNYVDVANNNLKNYTDTTFVKLANTSQEISGSITVSNEVTVQGKLTVGGDFVLSGDIIYDTDVLTISTVTPVATSGAGYFGVFRGSNSGGPNGGIGGPSSNANAYIRWNATSNTWQIRDVFNTDVSTSYQNVLTANNINASLTSVSTTVALSSLGANTLNDRIVTANTNMKNYVDVANTNLKNYVDVANTNLKNYVDVANTNLKNYVDVANTNMKNYVDVANTNLKNYTDVTITTANTNMKNYVDVANTNLKNYTDTTFIKGSGSGSSQTITGDLNLTGNVVISQNFTVSGTVTTVNTNEVNIADNEIVLNSDLPTASAPTESAGFTINRGSATNTYVRWNETIDAWVANNGTSSTSEFRIANNTTYLTEGTNLYYTDTRVRSAIGTSGSFGSPLNYISSNGTFQHLNSGVSQGNYGGAASVPVFTVNQTGHLSYAGNVAIAIASGAVSGLAASATTDTTVASNITSGTLPAARLPASGATPGVYGGAASVPTVTVDGTGRITSISNQSIAIASGAVSGLAASATTDTTVATNITTGTLNSARLDNSGASPGVYGGAATVPVVSVDSKGRVTSISNQSISITSGAVSGLAASATTNTQDANNITSGTLNAARLPATGVGAGTYPTAPGATSFPRITVDGTGRITGISSVSISFPAEADTFATVTGRGASTTSSLSITNATGASSKTSGALTIAGGLGVQGNVYTNRILVNNGSYERDPIFGVSATGILTATAGSLGTGMPTVSISHNNSNVVAGVYGGSSSVPVITVDLQGHITSVTTSTIQTSDQTLNTTNDVRFLSIGVNTAAPGGGAIRATGDITAGYSDENLKNRLGNIENALDKVKQLTGFYYKANEKAQELGYTDETKVGVSAQEVKKVMPEVVVPSGIDEKYLTVQYEKLVPLLIEAIKELDEKIEKLKKN